MTVVGELSRRVRAPRELPWGAPTAPLHAEPLPPKNRTGVDYDGAWSRRYPARLARALLVDGVTRPAVHVVARPRVRGLDTIAGLAPPLIFAANHASHIDTPLLLTCLPPRFRHRVVVGAAADYFFDKTWKAALWSLAVGAIPVERRRVSRRSAHLASELLEAGWNLVIFPEGGRTPDGWGQEFKGGAAYLAKRTGTPVVPIHIAGTRGILGKDARSLRPQAACVTFGRLIVPAEDEDARRLAARIESAVAALGDEAGSDWWVARRRAAAGATPPLHGPDVAPWRRSWTLEPARRAEPRVWPREGRRR